MNADNHVGVPGQHLRLRLRPAGPDRQGDQDRATAPATETYIHDANGNVVTQTVERHDHDVQLRPQPAADRRPRAARPPAYNYDPFGRLDTVTARRPGQREVHLRRLRPHVVEHRKQAPAAATTTTGTPTTRSTAPRPRPRRRHAERRPPTSPTWACPTRCCDEEVAGSSPSPTSTAPWGERLSQVKHNGGGTEEVSLLRLQPAHRRRDLTNENGDTRATYGYTAYGSNDDDPVHRRRQARPRRTPTRSRTTPTGSTPSAGTPPPATTTWASATTTPA